MTKKASDGILIGKGGENSAVELDYKPFSDSYLGIRWAQAKHMWHYLIPINKIQANEAGCAEFQALTEAAKEIADGRQIEFETRADEQINMVTRSAPGGMLKHYPAYSLIELPGGGVELTIAYGNCAAFRFWLVNLENTVSKEIVKEVVVPTNSRKGKGVGGYSFRTFSKICKEFGLDIKKYQISPDEGAIVKETMPSPLICELKGLEFGETYENVHHIDLNSAYMSGLCDSYPEFYPPVRYLYGKRKENPENKLILNATYGYMMSRWIKYRYAHLSKVMMEYTIRCLWAIKEALEVKGWKPLLFNTDGLWYQGEPVAENTPGYGPDLLQFKVDHKNCRFRAKSAGAYEYIEDGKYHAVLRGRTKYDEIVPRDQWVWGDIFRIDTAEQLFVEITESRDFNYGYKETEEIIKEDFLI